jgi:hypothetical protein
VLCGKRLGTSVSGLGTDGLEDSLRKRILTIGLAAPLFLLATLVPVDDVVVRIGPQCFPSLHWHGSGTGMFSRVDSTATRSYNLEDRDYLIRTVAFEAANEPSLGKAAVAHVVLNRARRAADGVTRSRRS